MFLRERKLNTSFVLILQPYFKASKTIKLNMTHFIVKILNKGEQIASSHSPDIDFKDFMKFYGDYTKETYSLLVNDTTFSSDNKLQFRKNIL